MLINNIKFFMCTYLGILYLVVIGLYNVISLVWDMDTTGCA